MSDLRFLLDVYREENQLVLNYLQLMNGIDNKLSFLSYSPQSANLNKEAENLRACYESRVAHIEDPLLKDILTTLAPFIRWQMLAKHLVVQQQKVYKIL